MAPHTGAAPGTSTRRSGAEVAAIVGLACTAFAARAMFALAGPTTAIAADVVQDDAFYYLGIARSVVAGAGLRFDGNPPTNAFHPLWLGLLLPGEWLQPGAVWTPLRVAMWQGALIGALTVPLLHALTRRLAGRGAALFAAATFAASPHLATLGVNALETGLAFALGLALTHTYVVRMAARARPSLADGVRFGALGGVAVLARIDLALLLGALGAHAALRSLRGARADVPRALAPLAVAACASLAVWLPWAAVSWLATGELVPTSAASSREIALHLGWSNLTPVFGPATGGLFDPALPPATWFADVGVRALFVWLLEQPLLAPLRFEAGFSIWPQLTRFAPFRVFAWLARAHPALAAGVAAALVLAALAWVARALWQSAAPGPASPRRPVRLGGALGLFVVLTFAGYLWLSPSHWYFTRYLALPIWLSMLGVLAPLSARVAAAAPARRAAAAAGVILVGLQLVLLARYAGGDFAAARTRPPGFLASWRALAPRLPTDARGVGAFQAGIHGWFSGRDIVDLDGKVNRDAAAALRAGRSCSYALDEAGIDYVIDQAWMVDALCLSRAPQALRQRFVPIARERRRGGATLYRLRPAAGPGDGA